MKIIASYHIVDADRTIKIAMKLHEINPSTLNANIEPIEYSYNRYTSPVIAQDNDKALIMDKGYICVCDGVERNIAGKQTILSVYSKTVTVLIEEFTKEEIDKISYDSELKNISYLTRAKYNETIERKKQFEILYQEKKILSKRQREQQIAIYAKKSKTTIETKFYNQSRTVTADKTRLTIIEGSRSLSFELFPVQVNNYLTFLLLEQLNVHSVGTITRTALEYYKQNYKTIPNITMKIKTSLGNYVDLDIKCKNNKILIQNMLIHPKRFQQLINYIIQNIEEANLGNAVRLFAKSLQQFNTEQLNVLQQKTYNFEPSRYYTCHHNTNIKVPFEVGVDKKGWYVQFKRKHYLKWQSPDKKDIKHILSYARNDRLQHRWRDHAELVYMITKIIEDKNFENEFAKYISEVLVINKI